MDTPSPRVAFGPDRRITGLATVGAVAALILAVTGSDPAGRLLAAIATGVLLAYVVSDLVFNPRLTASAEGLVIRAPTARATLAWRDVEHVHADSRLRFGLRSTTLEIDAGVTLVVLSRRALGADPNEVAELVNALRPG